jgi:hypothetical protein
MHLGNYLQYLLQAEKNLAEGFRKKGDGHILEVDIFHTTDTLAEQCEAHAERLEPFCEKYGKEKITKPERLYHELFGETGQGARDMELLEVVNACEGQTAIQIKWLRTRMKQAAPRALLVAS